MFFISGCGPTHKAQLQEFYKNLDGAVNKMTYDQAIATWGPPTSITQGDKVFVATWFSERKGAAAMPIGNMMFAVPLSHGWELGLTFNKETKKMVYWRYREW